MMSVTPEIIFVSVFMPVSKQRHKDRTEVLAGVFVALEIERSNEEDIRESEIVFASVFMSVNK